MKGWIKEDDVFVFYFYNGYYYIMCYEVGKDYFIYFCKKGFLDVKEEIMFNVNEMVKEYVYYSLWGVNVSFDNKWVVFGVDILSRR